MSVQGFVCSIQWHLLGASRCQAPCLSAYVHELEDCLPPPPRQGLPVGPGARLCTRDPRQAHGPLPLRGQGQLGPLGRGLSGTAVPECGPLVTCQLLAVFCPGSHEPPGQLPAKTMYLLIFQAFSGACKADCIYLCAEDFGRVLMKIN